MKGKKVVWIVPLVNRVGDVEVNEVGIGQGDCMFSLSPFFCSHKHLVYINDGGTDENLMLYSRIT